MEPHVGASGGPPADPARALRSPDPAVRRAACTAAAQHPAGTLYLEPLVERLGDSEPAVAAAAAQALGALGRRDAAVLPALRAALRGRDPGTRLHAALALMELEPPHPGLLPALVDGLADPRGAVRWAAARAVVDTGRLHGEVLPLLLGLVSPRHPAAVRRMAAFALRELAPDRPEAARVLLEAAGAADAVVRRAAVAALAGLDEATADAAARLETLVQGDPDPAVRVLAAGALGELASRSAPELAARMRGALERARQSAAEPALRDAAARALGRGDPGTPP